MIAAYRLVPLISNNVRTLFCGTAKLSPKLNEPSAWMDALLKNVKTDGRTYQLLEVRSNVRVLLITDDLIADKRGIYGAICIGAGSEDNPDMMHGRAHLLEHTLVEMVYHCTSVAGETFNRQTVYSFRYLPEERDEALQQWSKFLFSKDKLETLNIFVPAIIGHELDKVDSEFHQNRSNKAYRNLGRVKEILIRCGGSTLHGADCGYKKMLIGIGIGMDDAQKSTRFLNELNTFRDIYRQRPVNICICSAEKQDMKSILNSLNVDQYLQNGTAEVAKQDWPKRYECKTDFSEHLIVSTSVDDIMQFHIIFPLTKTLSRTEQNTIDLICNMISVATEGCLKRWLLKKKWATQVQAGRAENYICIYVNLTTGLTGGLRKIDEVEKAIQKYLTFLHDNWAKISEFIYRNYWKTSNNQILKSKLTKEILNYAKYIATHLDDEMMKKTEFDGKYFFDTLPNASEQALIKEQLLNNTKKIFAISNRDRELVLHDLDHILEKQTVETEHIYGGHYSIHNIGDFFKNQTISVCTEFKLEDLRKFYWMAETSHKIPVCLRKNTDVTYRKVLETHLDLELDRFSPLLNCGTLSATFDELTYNHPAGALPLTNFFTDFNCREMAEEDFNMCKQHLMRGLSEDLTDPATFAQDLLSVALSNIHNTIKMDASPMQYKSLKQMTHEKFTDRLKELDPTIIEPKRTSQKKVQSYKECFIRSMNQNEMSTITLLFCQTDDESDESTFRDSLEHFIGAMRTEKNLYSAYCENSTVAEFEGFLVKVRSVENKRGQKHDKIIKSIKDIITLKIPNEMKEKYPGQNLKIQYNKFIGRMILIQVYGHDVYGVNDASFESQFDTWYAQNQGELRKLLRLVPRKVPNTK